MNRKPVLLGSCLLAFATLLGKASISRGVDWKSTWETENGIRVDVWRRADWSRTREIESGIRVGVGCPSSPDVVRLPDGRYRMFYGAVPDSGNYPIVIRSATSVDGLSWASDDGIRIGQGHGGQEGWAGTPETVVLSDGRYRLYYSNERYPFGDPQWGHIRSAVSTDGLTWKAEPGVRVDRGGPRDTLRAICPSIVRLSGGRYRMYYAGSDGKHYRILSAASRDGLDWTKDTGIRLDIGGNHDGADVSNPQVVRLPDATFMMFYVGYDLAGVGRILSAVSTDGLTWRKRSRVAIAPQDVQAVDGGTYRSVSPGHFMHVAGNQWRLYFCADKNVTGPSRSKIFSALGALGQPPGSAAPAAHGATRIGLKDEQAPRIGPAGNGSRVSLTTVGFPFAGLLIAAGFLFGAARLLPLSSLPEAWSAPFT